MSAREVGVLLEAIILPEDMDLLASLGESADWLKDSDDVSIREHRLATMDAFRASWADPSDEDKRQTFTASVNRLLAALRHNDLVPDSVLMKRTENGDACFLPSTDSFCRDFESLVNHYAANKHGIGEIHLLNAVLYLRYLDAKADDAVYDEALEECLGDVLFLRNPAHRISSKFPFSVELQGYFHAIRTLRCMRKLGLCDEEPASRVTRQDQLEMTKLMTDPLCAEAGKCIPKAHLAAFRILDRASALQAYARAHAANRLADDPRSPEELFIDLRQRLRKLPSYTVLGPIRVRRLFRLGIAAIVRVLAHVDTQLGGKMYAFLRNRAHPTHLRHASMFKLLPNIDERLRFINFLCTHGKQNPMFFVKRFQKFFGGATLRFVGKDAGFVLDPFEERKIPTSVNQPPKPDTKGDSTP